jgi:IS30 family transposase
MDNEPPLSLTSEEMSYSHIKPSDRNELSAFLRVNTPQKEIARQLGKDRTTIWRERKRNEDENGKYHARKAKERTRGRQEEAHAKQRKIENSPWLQNMIGKKTKKRWSPEQTAGWLKRKYPNDKKKRIGKDSIYEYIYAERKDLVKFLRCQKGNYRRRYGTRIREKARDEAKKKRIDTRPAIVETKGRIGDYEGDTIVGSDKNHILTHNERKSGMLFADKLETPTAEETRKVTVARFKNIPRDKKHTITYDNGVTFASHAQTEEKTGMIIYFAYPYHSWERGCNENSNGLLRQYFPKRTPLGKVNKEDLRKAVREINGRPRKRHGYFTPYEIYNQKNEKIATDS